MSAFLTEIPVDIEAVKRLLPKDSYIEGVAWNKETQKVELTWSNHKLRTPYNIPTPFLVQDLHDQKLPKCVTIRENRTETTQMTDAEQSPKQTPDNATDSVKVVDVKPRRGVKKR